MLKLIEINQERWLRFGIELNSVRVYKRINNQPDRAIPNNVKLKRGQYWCPYCSNPVKFINDEKLGVKRCPICGISNRDYYVKKVNNLWQ